MLFIDDALLFIWPIYLQILNFYDNRHNLPINFLFER